MQQRKVIFVKRYFHPDISATNQLLSDLAIYWRASTYGRMSSPASSAAMTPAMSYKFEMSEPLCVLSGNRF
jgi:hypothetical protein